MNRSIIIAVALATSAWMAQAEQILLRGSDGTAHGPFEVRNGEKITLKGEEFAIEVLTKTPAQAKLEEKLRSTTVDLIEFTEVPLDTVFAFFSAKHQVNIVPTASLVTNRSGLKVTLTLRNVPLYDAFRYIAKLTDCTFHVEDAAVVFDLRPSTTAGRRKSK